MDFDTEKSGGEIMNSEQGKKAPTLFKGDGNSNTSKIIYGESADLFSQLIRKEFKPSKLSLIDFGTSGGEFLDSLLKKLPEYRFSTIGIDRERKALDKNSIVDTRMNSDLVKISLKDNCGDIVIMRYVLQWDSIKKQKIILSELNRVMNKFAIIQHAGADSKNAEKWRKTNDNLFKGKISALNRFEQFF